MLLLLLALLWLFLTTIITCKYLKKLINGKKSINNKDLEQKQIKNKKLNNEVKELASS